MATLTMPEDVHSRPMGKAVAIEADDSSDDATEEEVEGEEPVCHTYKNKNARIELCEVELDEYMSDVSSFVEIKGCGSLPPERDA